MRAETTFMALVLLLGLSMSPVFASVRTDNACSIATPDISSSVADVGTLEAQALQVIFTHLLASGFIAYLPANIKNADQTDMEARYPRSPERKQTWTNSGSRNIMTIACGGRS